MCFTGVLDMHNRSMNYMYNIPPNTTYVSHIPHMAHLHCRWHHYSPCLVPWYCILESYQTAALTLETSLKHTQLEYDLQCRAVVESYLLICLRQRNQIIKCCQMASIISIVHTYIAQCPQSNGYTNHHIQSPGRILQT